MKKIVTIIILLCLASLDVLRGNNTNSNSPILIISSYNPEIFRNSKNISEFLNEYDLLGGLSPIVIENMNCKSFSESSQWKVQMKGILSKYTGYKSPCIIILLGQEALMSYLQQGKKNYFPVPVLCGMLNVSTIPLPDEKDDWVKWAPGSIDIREICKGKINVSGFVYEYNVKDNIRLIRKLYPKTERIAFVSDNSYTGVLMQALVKEEMREFPDLDLILIDGREYSVSSAIDEIIALPPNTAVLSGTWKIDKDDGYFMRNATYGMLELMNKLPIFSLTRIGERKWVLGGVSPRTQDVGKLLAQQVVDIQKSNTGYGDLNIIPNYCTIDHTKFRELGIDAKLLPADIVYINKQLTFFEKYRFYIWGFFALFTILLIIFIVTLFFYLRTKRLKDALLISKAELLKAKEKAEESDRLKSAFLANISHEVRTPLNAIVGFASVLSTDEHTHEEQSRYLDIIRTNSDLLLRLINDILDISSLESGELKLNYTPCDVVALCRKVLLTTSYLKKEGVEYIFTPSYNSYIIETDCQRLQQILINLLSNAGKFTKKGRIILSFEEGRENNRLVFSVTDTGCGIPVNMQDKVFERFEKLNNYVQGSGLGLAICKLTIERLGGEIWVDKNYITGSRFVFTHPIQKKSSEP